MEALEIKALLGERQKAGSVWPVSGWLLNFAYESLGLSQGKS